MECVGRPCVNGGCALRERELRGRDARGGRRARPKRLRRVPGPAYHHICARNVVSHGLGKDVRPSEDGPTRQRGHFDPPTRNASVPQRPFQQTPR